MVKTSRLLPPQTTQWFWRGIWVTWAVANSSVIFEPFLNGFRVGQTCKLKKRMGHRKSAFQCKFIHFHSFSFTLTLVRLCTSLFASVWPNKKNISTQKCTEIFVLGTEYGARCVALIRDQRKFHLFCRSHLEWKNENKVFSIKLNEMTFAYQMIDPQII